MHKKLRSTALLVTFGSLAACQSATAPGTAPDVVLAASMSGGTGMVPISVREAYAPAPGKAFQPCEPAAAGVALPVTSLAWGQGTHLGRVTSVLTGDVCTVDLSTGTISLAGSAVHTAANGDQLLAEFAGTLSAGILTLTSITFTGGTGRFADVVGSGTGSGTIDPTTASGRFEVIGMISRPNR